MRKKKSKLKMWAERNLIPLVCIIIILFPLAIGLFYALPFPQIIKVESGDLLAFYGTMGGIVFSFWTYRREKAKEKRQRDKELRPQIMVELMKQKKSPVFEVSIHNLSSKPLRYVWFHEASIAQMVKQEITFTASYSLSSADVTKYDPDHNICSDENIIDQTGYPVYVQILCEDYDGNTWNCCFHKVNDSPIYYYPDVFEII